MCTLHVTLELNLSTNSLYLVAYNICILGIVQILLQTRTFHSILRSGISENHFPYYSTLHFTLNWNQYYNIVWWHLYYLYKQTSMQFCELYITIIILQWHSLAMYSSIALCRISCETVKYKWNAVIAPPSTVIWLVPCTNQQLLLHAW